MPPTPALFLDRDGVINADHAYVHKIEDFHFLDGIFELCQAAQKKGYKIIIITNQAGIGRGYYSEEDFHHLTEWMKEQFLQRGVTIDGVYFSPYHPEHGVGHYKKVTDCRKPNPGMILTAQKELDIDLANSVLVGDKESDIQAGENAGVGTSLLFRPNIGKIYAIKYQSDYAVVDSLEHISNFLKPNQK